MPFAWLSIAILCTVGYHLVTYAMVTALFAVLLLAAPGAFEWRQELRQLNWTALALAAVIIGLDLGFLYLYRSGFEVSLGALVTQSAAALLLLVIGVAVFRERLSAANLAGLVLCIVGLWLVNRR